MKSKKEEIKDPGFNIKAVDGKNNSIYGIIRMKGTDVAGDYSCRVIGICGLFETDKQRENFYFCNNLLFFYGNTEDLKKNYSNGIPSDLKLEEFTDNKYSERTSYRDKAGDAKLGYMLIPVEKMNLEPCQKVLVTKLFSKTEENLPKLIEGIIKDECNSSSHIGNVFASFPSELEAKALKKGVFYRKRRTRREPGDIVLPDMKIIIISVENLSEWAEWARSYGKKFKN